MGGLRLTHGEPLAPTLVYGERRPGRDGFFDAASGLRIWRPRDAAAQAAVRDDGTTLVLYAERGGKRGEPGKGARRLVLLRPGRAPDNRRLEVPRNASALLLPRALVWWGPAASPRGGDETITVQTLGSDRHWLGSPRRLGQAPAGARLRGACAHGNTAAVLLAAPSASGRSVLLIGRGHTLDGTVTVDHAAASGTLSCHEGFAWLTRLADARLLAQHCRLQRCDESQSSSLPSSTDALVAAAPLGPQMMLAVADKTGTISVRVDEPAALMAAPERRWRLVNRDGAPLRPRAVRLLAAGRTAWLLVETRTDELFTAYIEPNGALRAVGRAAEPSDAPSGPAR